MPDLSELNLTEESTPQVDWDAPEAGQIPPSVSPGSFLFTFHLPEKMDDWFDVQEVEMEKGKPKVKFLVICYIAKLKGDAKGELFAAPEGGELPKVNFQRASFYKNDKMLISNGGELLRALGQRITGQLTPEAIREALAQVDGRVDFFADVKWTAYYKSDQTTFSTMPNKKKGHIPWPKEADGSYAMTVAHPLTGQKMYGRPELLRYRAVSNT